MVWSLQRRQVWFDLKNVFTIISGLLTEGVSFFEPILIKYLKVLSGHLRWSSVFSVGIVIY